MEIKIKIVQLAALSDCIEGVDLVRVDHYRQALRSGEKVEPIRVRNMNPQGFYVLFDGNHRTLAHALEGCDQILAEIDPTAKVMDLSWRFPRIAPVAHTLELIKLSRP